MATLAHPAANMLVRSMGYVVVTMVVSSLDVVLMLCHGRGERVVDGIRRGGLVYLRLDGFNHSFDSFEIEWWCVY